jgi:hypothetical protein
VPVLLPMLSCPAPADKKMPKYLSRDFGTANFPTKVSDEGATGDPWVIDCTCTQSLCTLVLWMCQWELVMCVGPWQR